MDVGSNVDRLERKQRQHVEGGVVDGFMHLFMHGLPQRQDNDCSARKALGPPLEAHPLVMWDMGSRRASLPGIVTLDTIQSLEVKVLDVSAILVKAAS